MSAVSVTGVPDDADSRVHRATGGLDGTAPEAGFEAIPWPDGPIQDSGGSRHDPGRSAGSQAPVAVGAEGQGFDALGSVRSGGAVRPSDRQFGSLVR
jgi:hypothetical protein